MSLRDLVLQRHGGAAVAAEGGYSFQIARGARNDHDWTVAIDRVAGRSQIPLPPLVRWVMWLAGWRGACGGASLGTGKLNNKARVRAFIFSNSGFRTPQNLEQNYLELDCNFHRTEQIAEP